MSSSVPPPTDPAPLISRQQIALAVADLADRLSQHYAGCELTVLGVLTGSVVFVADLMRQLRVPHQVGFLQASSYRGAATAPGELRLNVDFLPDVQNRDVLLVDDIFDTGRTLGALTGLLLELGPRSVRTAVLLWKPDRTLGNACPDEYCFQIADRFVVGYGLDHDGRHRHLPDICALDEPQTG